MKQIILAAMLALIACVPARAAATEAPPGFRFPGAADMKYEWSAHARLFPEPYRARADFNCDGAGDDAWILLRTTGRGWGVFVLLGGSPGRVVQVAESRGGYPYYNALRVADPGRYKVIGDAGKVEAMALASPAINLFGYEGGNTLFYWDDRAGGFRKVMGM